MKAKAPTDTTRKHLIGVKLTDEELARVDAEIARVAEESATEPMARVKMMRSLMLRGLAGAGSSK